MLAYLMFMKISKEAVINTLKTISLPGDNKNIIDKGAVSNVLVFGDQVDIDIKLNNPSLQARKKLEVIILKTLHEKVYEKAKIKINISVVAQEKKDGTVNGKTISGIENIIAISSGKGGVGKSTITANIAVTLSNMGCKVGVLDADIYGPSIPTMFDVEGKKPLSVRVNGKSKMEPIKNYGVQILSIGFFTQPNQAVIWRGPMATKALNQMIFDANWGDLDFLLIDLPPGTGDIHLSIVQSLPISGAVVVSTPQNVALSDAKKGIAMFQQKNINVPVLGIIENMSYFTPEELPKNKYYIFGKRGAEYLANDMQVPFLGSLPLVQSVRESADYGRPASMQEKTSIKNDFILITKNLVSQVLNRNKNLPPTKAVEITNLVGCDAIKTQPK